MSKVKIIYEDLAVGASEASTNTTTDKQAFSNLELLKKDTVFPKYGNPCEFGQNVLDGSQLTMPTNLTAGWWSLSQSKRDKNFTTPPVLTVAFSGIYTGVGVTLVFDIENNTWCNDLTVAWFRDNVQISSKNYAPNSSKFFCQNNVKDYNKIVITFKKMCAPFSYLKLHKIDLGVVRTFLDDEIKSIKVQEELSPISEEISINTLDFLLKSKTDVEFIFQKKQRMLLYFNEKLRGCYFIETSKRTSESEYDFQMVDYIGILEKMSFSGGIYVNKTAISLATEIMSNIPFQMDENLKTKTVSGWLPIGTARTALLQLAFAIGAAVDTTQSEKVLIFSLNNAVKKIFEQSEIYIGENFDEEDKVTEIQVTEHSYIQAQEVRELFKDNTGTNIFVTFSEPMHSLSISNGAIIQSNANYAVINANSGCILSGKVYKDNQRIISVKNPIISANDLQNVLKFEQSTLISKANSSEISQKIYDYYLNSSYTNTKFKIANEKVGDMVEVATEYLGTKKGRIIALAYGLNSNNIVAQAVIENE